MNDSLVELRGDVPLEYAETLDAVAFARGNGANRMTVLREVLALWHRSKLHEASLVLKVNRSKGSRGEAAGNRSEPLV